MQRRRHEPSAASQFFLPTQESGEDTCGSCARRRRRVGFTKRCKNFVSTMRQSPSKGAFTAFYHGVASTFCCDTGSKIFMHNPKKGMDSKNGQAPAPAAPTPAAPTPAAPAAPTPAAPTPAAPAPTSVSDAPPTHFTYKCIQDYHIPARVEQRDNKTWCMAHVNESTVRMNPDGTCTKQHPESTLPDTCWARTIDLRDGSLQKLMPSTECNYKCSR